MQEKATLPKTVCLVLGNNTEPETAKIQLMNQKQKQIINLHKNECADCTDWSSCSRVLFATCNLQTKTNVKQVLRRMGRELIVNTSKFISATIGNKRYSSKLHHYCDLMDAESDNYRTSSVYSYEQR